MSVFDHGLVTERKTLHNEWRVRVWEHAGHTEISIRNEVAIVEVGQLLVEPLPYEGEIDPQWEIDARLANQKRAARRAQTMCRRVIKAEGFDELLTITYRDNQCDRALAKHHFALWVRRMRQALGEFRYCASFEKQQRGAMHMHVACHKLPKVAGHRGVTVKGFELGTRIWRSIVGHNNGLVFVGGKKKAGHSKRSVARSPAKMAQYVSKYIAKDFEENPLESNRYSRSDGAPLGKKTTFTFNAESLATVIDLVFHCPDGFQIVSNRLGYFRDSYWLCIEKTP